AVHGCRLARAVRPEQAETFALLNFERYAANRPYGLAAGRLVAFGELADGERNGHSKYRMCSLRMQRSITTSNPAARARSAAASWMTPSCIQITLACLRIAASTMSGTYSGRR